MKKDKEVLITRIFHAPREVVFKAWTDADHLLRWYAPAGCNIHFARIDIRPGGTFHSCILTPDNHECWCVGEYLEIEAPERIVHTMAVADEHGNRIKATDAGMDPDWPEETTLTVTFEDLGNSTRLTLRQTVSESLAKKTGAYPSWINMFDRLEESISVSKPLVIEKTYHAPIGKVWKAITNKEDMKQWYFDLEAFEPEVGFEFSFSGKGKKGEEYLHLCRVTEAVPGKKIAYSWRYQDQPGSSEVTFELFEEGDHTRLKLTHTGLDSFPGDTNPDFGPDSFLAGWTYLLGTALKNFTEKEGQ